MKSTERKLSVRPQTKRKFVQIAGERGWSHAETADRAADALLEKEGVSMPEASAGQGHGHGGPSRRKQPRRSAA
jgi:hypothetical protein